MGGVAKWFRHLCRVTRPDHSQTIKTLLFNVDEYVKGFKLGRSAQFLSAFVTTKPLDIDLAQPAHKPIGSFLFLDNAVRAHIRSIAAHSCVYHQWAVHTQLQVANWLPSGLLRCISHAVQSCSATVLCPSRMRMLGKVCLDCYFMYCIQYCRQKPTDVRGQGCGRLAFVNNAGLGIPINPSMYRW